MDFQLVSEYKPTGDQPQAIEKLVNGVKMGLNEQVLLGVTGSGKTFTMANVIHFFPSRRDNKVRIFNILWCEYSSFNAYIIASLHHCLYVRNYRRCNNFNLHAKALQPAYLSCCHLTATDNKAFLPFYFSKKRKITHPVPLFL